MDAVDDQIWKAPPKNSKPFFYIFGNKKKHTKKRCIFLQTATEMHYSFLRTNQSINSLYINLFYCKLNRLPPPRRVVCFIIVSYDLIVVWVSVVLLLLLYQRSMLYEPSKMGSLF